MDEEGKERRGKDKVEKPGRKIYRKKLKRC